MRKIAVLGSTGSVGTQALDVIAALSDCSVTALSCETNVDKLLKQIEAFKPKYVCVSDEASYEKARMALNQSDTNTQIFHDLEEMIDKFDEVDLVINALVGSAGLVPTVRVLDKAIERKALMNKSIDIALANKETLVCAGKLIMNYATHVKVSIIPIDSEHSAIFQCLAGNNKADMTKIHLTGSGGPFRSLPSEKLADVSIESALAHPNWSMGRKITIDSATLMNKGLEMIEAKWLFDVEMEDINILIHPESIIHSMVEFRDGSIMAQLGSPDMRVPIAYALTYPKRAALDIKPMNFTELGALTFEKPRYDDFPCLNLCKEAMKTGGTMPALLNGANEAAVELFLNEKIKFTDIPVIIEKAMGAYTYKENYSLSDVLEADTFGKNYVNEVKKCL